MILKTHEVAAILGVSMEHARRILWQGVLQGTVQVAGQAWIMPADIATWATDA
jgi:hypothetical protein